MLLLGRVLEQEREQEQVRWEQVLVQLPLVLYRKGRHIEDWRWPV